MFPLVGWLEDLTHHCYLRGKSILVQVSVHKREREREREGKKFIMSCSRIKWLWNIFIHLFSGTVCVGVGCEVGWDTILRCWPDGLKGYKFKRRRKNIKCMQYVGYVLCTYMYIFRALRRYVHNIH